MKFSIIFSVVILSFLFHQCSEPCDDNECQNNGICVEGVCDCPEGFLGDNCEINLSQRLKKLIGPTNYFIEYEYNLNNKLSKQTSYDDNFEIMKESEFTMRDDTIIETITRLSPFRYTEKRYFEYSESAIIAHIYGTNSSQPYGKTHYIFSSECGMTEEIHFGRNDVELSSTTWAYDETTCNHKLRHIDEEGAISSSEDIIILQDKINPIPSVFDHFNKKRSALVDTSYFYLHANDPDGVYMHGISYVVDYEFNGNEAPVLQTRKYLNVTDPDTFASFEYY